MVAGLESWVGPRGLVDDAVIVHALKHSPSIIIDCANKADPHRFHGRFPSEAFASVYSFQTDLLYTFRELLRVIPRYCLELGARLVVVTSFDKLFSYDAVEEDADVFLNIWELLSVLGGRFEVFVAVDSDNRQLSLAKRFSVVKEVEVMGHTVMSQREVVDGLLRELRAYARSLRAEDRLLFERVCGYPLKHVGSITYASSLHAWAFFLLSALVEQERRLEEFRCKDG